jgi:hypothetical protein
MAAKTVDSRLSANRNGNRRGYDMDDSNGRRAGWWSAGEALAWIAFGCFIEGGHWPRLPEFKTAHDWKVRDNLTDESGLLETGWVLTAPDLIQALQAAPDSFDPKSKIDALAFDAARRLRRQGGLASASLVKALESDLEKMQRAEAQLERAARTLTAALDAGILQARGRPTLSYMGESKKGAPEAIPSDVFGHDYPLGIDIEGCTVAPVDDYEGQHWIGVEIKSDDLMEQFPEPSISKNSLKTDIDIFKWLGEWALIFCQEHGRPPFRDKDAVVAGTREGFSARSIQRAYQKLPPNLRMPARKPQQTANVQAPAR